MEQDSQEKENKKGNPPELMHAATLTHLPHGHNPQAEDSGKGQYSAERRFLSHPSTGPDPVLSSRLESERHPGKNG